MPSSLLCCSSIDLPVVMRRIRFTAFTQPLADVVAQTGRAAKSVRENAAGYVHGDCDQPPHGSAGIRETVLGRAPQRREPRDGWASMDSTCAFAMRRSTFPPARAVRRAAPRVRIGSKSYAGRAPAILVESVMVMTLLRGIGTAGV